MALVLLRLRLAILRRGRGSGGAAQRVWFLLSWVIALVLGLGVGGMTALAASSPGPSGDLLVVLVTTVVFLAWLISPILLPGLADEVVDPARLEQFPVRPRDQVLGGLLGGLVGPTALFTFLAAVGPVVADGASVGARLVTVVFAFVFTVMCVSGARSVQALLTGALRSRRGRDLVLVLGGVLGLGAYLASQAVHDVTGAIVALENSAVVGVLGWLPSGALGHATIDVREGMWLLATLRLLVALGTVALFLTAWSWALGRRVRGVSARAGARRTAGGPQVELGLFPPVLAALEPTPARAAAAQQLRYYLFRSPQAVQGGLLPFVIAVVFAHTAVASGGVVVGAAAMAAFVAAVSTAFINVFGYDDAGVRYLVQGAAPMDQVLRGKSLALLGPAIVVLAVFVLVEAGLTNAWGEVLPSLFVGSAVLALGAGIGAHVSVLTPQNRVSRQIAKGRALLTAFAVLAVMAVAATAVVLAAQALGEAIGTTAAAGALLVLAAAVTWLLLRTAGSALDRRPLRLLRLLGTD